VAHGSFQNIQRAIDEYFHCLARSLSTAGNAQSRLMKNVFHTCCHFVHGCCVANVAFNHSHTAVAVRRREVVPGASHEVVEDAHFCGARGEQLVGDGAPDKTGAAGDQNVRSLNRVRHELKTL
jgi:hypothetical protein